MANRSPRGKPHVDQDGVRTTESAGVRTSVWLLALALALVGWAVFVVFRPALQHAWGPPSASSAADATAAVSTPHGSAALGPQHRPAAIPPARREVPQRPEPAAQAEPTRAAAPPAPPAAPNSAAAAPAEKSSPPAADTEDSDEPQGVALFPPPGTKPIKRGIVVPEGVELPPGYVRHYQTTDDGRQLPAILMFHPDYQPLDEHGDLVPLPEDRVVPPEMAPPGIPVQILDVPENGTPAIGPAPRGPNRP